MRVSVFLFTVLHCMTQKSTNKTDVAYSKKESPWFSSLHVTTGNGLGLFKYKTTALAARTGHTLRYKDIVDALGLRLICTRKMFSVRYQRACFIHVSRKAYAQQQLV